MKTFFEDVQSSLERERIERIVGKINPDLSRYNDPPSRVRTFLLKPEHKTWPVSCCLLKYDNKPIETAIYCSKYLRFSAGVKVVFDNFKREVPVRDANNMWGFILEDHDDIDKIPERLSGYNKKQPPISFNGYYVTILVQDTMDETVPEVRTVSGGKIISCSIEDSWKYFYDALQERCFVMVNLSQLRPANTANKVGLIASGPVGDGSRNQRDNSSFADIYRVIANFVEHGNIFTYLQFIGTINETVRKGGSIYKNGALTSSMDYRNPNFVEYVSESPLVELPGSHKKSVRYDKDIFSEEYESLIDRIIESANAESLFLEKRKGDRMANVCMGILGFDKFTCLIWRSNLAMFLPSTVHLLPDSLDEIAEKLTNLHIYWRKEVPEKAALVAPLEKDTQIAIDFLGLANMLPKFGCTYLRFIEVLEAYLAEDFASIQGEEIFKFLFNLQSGIERACVTADRICDEHGIPRFEYIFTVEPAQNHAFKLKDIDGNVTCRGIWPPFARREFRGSATQQENMYYHGKVEEAKDLGHDNHEKLCDLWYRFFNKFSDKRCHAISFDRWKNADRGWFEHFTNEVDMPTTYYNFSKEHDPSANHKRTLVISPDGDDAAEDVSSTMCGCGG